MHPLRLLLAFLFALASGCASISYTSQAIIGQLDLMARTRPIADILDDTAARKAQDAALFSPVAPAVRARLATVLRLRAFATEVLALPDNGSYTLYAEIDRPAVAWNVIATPALSFTAREWCYPFAGCVPYRGFFARDRAEREAARLRTEGLDVRVASVAAYSTLGWFRDPVLNTQLRQDDAAVAGVLIHELAHQQLYLPGDATFNESFATAVELEGLQRWLAQENNPQAWAKAEAELKRRQEFVEFVLPYRKRLETIFASASDAADQHTAKAQVYADLRAAWPALQARWGGEHGYAGWFAQDLNNAHLAGIGLYYEYVPAFRQLLRAHQGDLKAFYQAARVISRLSAKARREHLEQLSHSATAAAP